MAAQSGPPDLDTQIDSVTALSAPIPPMDVLEEQVPDALRERWYRADAEAVLARDLVWFLTLSGGSVGLAGALVAIATGIGNATGALVFAAMCLALVVSGQVMHRRAARGRDGFQAREIDLVLAHRRQVRFDDWNGSGTAGTPRTPGTGTATLPREARAADLAARTVRGIVGSRAWSIPDLAVQRSQFDPVRELRQITLALRDTYDLRVAVGEPPVHRGELWDAIRRDHAEVLGALTGSWSAVRDRLSALVDYRRRLEDLSETLAELERAEHIRLAGGRPLDDLVVHTVRHELAAREIHHMVSEIDVLQAHLGTPPTTVALDPATGG